MCPTVLNNWSMADDVGKMDGREVGSNLPGNSRKSCASRSALATSTLRLRELGRSKEGGVPSSFEVISRDVVAGTAEECAQAQ